MQGVALDISSLVSQGDTTLKTDLLKRAGTFFSRLQWQEVAFNLDAQLTGTMMRDRLARQRRLR